MHASLAVRLEPVAREAEIRPLAVDLHAEHAAVEVLGALEVLRYEQEVIQFGNGHGKLLVAMILTVPRLLPLLLWLFIAPAVAQSFEPYEGQPGKDVVWVPTRHALVERMLDLATVTERDFVVDLGSGDGRMVIAAAKRGARALGVEYEPEMVALARPVTGPGRAQSQRHGAPQRRSHPLHRRRQRRIHRARARRRDGRRSEGRLLGLLESHPPRFGDGARTRSGTQPEIVRAPSPNQSIRGGNLSSSKTEISGALPAKPYSSQRRATCSYAARDSFVRLENDLMNL